MGKRKTLDRKRDAQLKRIAMQQDIFLRTLAEGKSTTAAIQAAGTNDTTVYRWRKELEGFNERWIAAEEAGTDRLEDELLRRAKDGVKRMKFTAKGTPCMVRCDADDPEAQEVGEDREGNPIYMKPYSEQEYSDTLGIFLLKGRRPQKYRDNHKMEISGPDGGPIVLQALAEIEDTPGTVVDAEFVKEVARRAITSQVNREPEDAEFEPADE